MRLGFISIDLQVPKIIHTGAKKIHILTYEVPLHDVKFGIWCALQCEN